MPLSGSGREFPGRLNWGCSGATLPLMGSRDVKKSEGKTMVLSLAWLPLASASTQLLLPLLLAFTAIDDSQGTLQAFSTRLRSMQHLSFLPSPACRDPLLDYSLPIM